MKLVNVYAEPLAELVLYAALGDREPTENISHRAMPSWREHRAFVGNRPYLAWYLIKEGDYVGTIYLTHNREIGIHLFSECRGHGIGTLAIQMLRELHPGPLLANVNPANEPSIHFFKKHGGRLIQHTYSLGG